MQVNPGDIVTFEAPGDVTFSFGKGKEAERFTVQAGEFVEINRVTTLKGPECVVSHAQPPRTTLQRISRQQTHRKGGISFATLEVPDGIDPQVKSLEEKLQERGRTMKARLAQEAERLKGR